MKQLALRRAYAYSKSLVLEAGYGYEVDWQRSVMSRRFSENDFLRESGWVVLCSGFRESVVARWFDYISLCFCDWTAAEEIVRHRQMCRQSALRAIRSQRKIDAIIEIASIVHCAGFERLRERIERDPLGELQGFPYIGPITSQHLAKNLGFSYCKADRHLQRLAQAAGFSDVAALCTAVACASGEAVPVVDIVLWRFSVLAPDPPAQFRRAYLHEDQRSAQPTTTAARDIAYLWRQPSCQPIGRA